MAFMLLILFSAQLDGVSEKAKKRMADHHSINDWLELSDSFSRAARDKYGKKRVSSTQCGNLKIFLSFRFYVKSVMADFRMFFGSEF